jgi:hypothetical protein
MGKNKSIRIGCKLFFGLLGLISVVLEILTLMDRGTFNPGNFFSFFTIQSNIFAALVFIASAVLLLRGRGLERMQLLRGAATLYMTITGVVFAVLLSGQDASKLTAVPWDNVVLHYLVPLAVILDWLLDPPKKRLAPERALWWLAYPILYLLYSLVRGPLVEWYPYPFLDPANNGYAGVAAVAVAVAGLGVFVTWLLTRVARRPVFRR